MQFIFFVVISLSQSSLLISFFIFLLSFFFFIRICRMSAMNVHSDLNHSLANSSSFQSLNFDSYFKSKNDNKVYIKIQSKLGQNILIEKLIVQKSYVNFFDFCLLNIPKSKSIKWRNWNFFFQNKLQWIVQRRWQNEVFKNCPQKLIIQKS